MPPGPAEARGGGAAETPGEEEEEEERLRQRVRELGKGQMGSALNGVTANLIFFDRGAFWAFPLAYFYLPKSARAYLFPQYVKLNYFCSGPISVDPTCPRPRSTPKSSKSEPKSPKKGKKVSTLALFDPKPAKTTVTYDILAYLSLSLYIYIYIYTIYVYTMVILLIIMIIIIMMR